ncbi:hypothetical protein [Sporosarcina sp. FSL K6-5500]|uniref:hypothetical protein n=1 Tax=Sporosarcina sp. FSL K6-5500 TaxID=2921558 RepID=UPI0030F59649
MDVILNIEEQPSVEEMATFLKSLSEKELIQMSAMFQGVKLGLHLAKDNVKKESA